MGSEMCIRDRVKGTYHFPTTIGHEFAGQIVDCGDKVKNNLTVGDRVSVMPLIPCGECQYCKVGQSHLCDHYDYYGSRRDGAMAEYVVVESANCLKLPDNVDYEEGSFTDPVSVGLHAVRKCRMEAGKTAAVFGLGAIGFICVQWLRALGCTKVIAVDVADDKLALAKRLGAEEVYIVYRRGMEELPARKEEVEHAEEEGIIFKTLNNPVEILGDEEGLVSGIKCIEMELGEPDESGRRRPVEKPDSEFVLDVDSVIMSIGTSPNPLIRSTTPGLEANNRGCLITKDESGLTTRDNVYAGGDAVTGAATVILAMGAGKAGAKGIDEYLKNK